LEGWILPCNSNKQGSLDFEMGGTLFSIPRKQIVRESVKNRNGWCYSAITPTPGDVMIFGDIFVKNNYCVFDVEHLSIGIAPIRRG
jgi:hypothetical protein